MILLLRTSRNNALSDSTTIKLLSSLKLIAHISICLRYERRVKSLLSNQECCVEVSDIDEALLGIVATTATVTPEDLNNENLVLSQKLYDTEHCDRNRPPSMRSETSITTEEVLKTNNDREKSIFLRAALQLLDEENSAAVLKCSEALSDDNIHEKQRTTHNTTDFFRSKGKITQPQGTCPMSRVFREDNIRYGWLKKASKGGTFAPVSSVWKAKFVELRHGFFSYEDDFSGTKKAVKKSIPLSMDVCYCQVTKTCGKDGDCVFELSMRGGIRRMWQAASVRDRDAWILSINASMTKSPQRFLEPSKEYLSSKNSMRNLLEQSMNTNAMITSNANENGICFSSLTSRDGAAAPYADEISRYSAVMHVIKSVESVENYRHIIDQLRGIQLRITIPVFFVKVRNTIFDLNQLFMILHFLFNDNLNLSS